MEHIARAPAVLAVRAPEWSCSHSSCSDRSTCAVAEFTALAVALIAARVPAVEYIAPTLAGVRSACVSVVKFTASARALVAARAPAVELFAPATAGDRNTCASGGVRCTSPCLYRSMCASGGVHRTNSCG